MAHVAPEPDPARPDPLDPVSATEPTELPRKKANWLVRFFGGAGKASAGPAGPTQQSGGTPAP